MNNWTQNSHKRKIFNRKRIQFAYSILRWHGHLGVAAAVLFLVLLFTGIALNHTERLNLDQKYVGSDWLLSWYGIAPTNAPVSYRVGKHWITELDGHLFLDEKLIYERAGSTRGALETQNIFAAATENTLYLFDIEGAFIERVMDLPGEILRMGWRKNDIYIDTPMGVFSADPDFLVWKQADQAPIWTETSTVPSVIESDILKVYRGQGLPWERVVLDIHSGRILGSWGPYLMDGAALVLLILVASGVYNWVIRR